MSRVLSGRYYIRERSSGELLEAMLQANGNRMQAARRLRLWPSTLATKLRVLGWESRRFMSDDPTSKDY